MPVIPIESLDDPRILPFRDLPRSDLPKHAGLFIVEGPLLVQLLLASDFEVVSLLVDQLRPEFVSQVNENIPVYAAAKPLLQEIVGFRFHRGVLACGRRRKASSIDEVLADLPGQATIVACHEIHDPENLGGVLRSCAAFGVDAVLLSPRCTDPFSRRVLRVSMGTVFNLKLVESANLANDLNRLSENGLERIVAVLDDEAERLDQARRVRRVALLFGNEANGVDQDLVARCDRRVTIPMRLGTDSLNVSVAAGIVLYHFTQTQDS